MLPPISRSFLGEVGGGGSGSRMAVMETEETLGSSRILRFLDRVMGPEREAEEEAATATVAEEGGESWGMWRLRIAPRYSKGLDGEAVCLGLRALLLPLLLLPAGTGVMETGWWLLLVMVLLLLPP